MKRAMILFAKGFPYNVSEPFLEKEYPKYGTCLLYTSPSPRDPKTSRMPSSA